MMEIMMVLLGIMTTLVVVAVAGLPLWAWLLANFDICFTFVEEGTAKAVMRGKEFHKFLLQSKGMRFADDGSWDIIPLAPRERAPKNRWFERLSGARWMGLWPFFQLYRYNFKWTVSKQRQESGEIKVVPLYRDENVDSIFIRDAVYYGKVQAAETTDNTPVDVEYLLTIRIINPYQALFRVHRWLEAVLDLTSQRGRQYVGTRSYKQLVAEEKAQQSAGFSGGIKSLRGHLSANFGVMFVYADIASIEFSGATTHDKYVEASTAAYLADAKAVEIVKTAEADAKAIELRGKAEAEALGARMEQYQNNPEAAQATINGDVGKALGLDRIAKALSLIFGGTKQGGN